MEPPAVQDLEGLGPGDPDLWDLLLPPAVGQGASHC